VFRVAVVKAEVVVASDPQASPSVGGIETEHQCSDNINLTIANFRWARVHPAAASGVLIAIGPGVRDEHSTSAHRDNQDISRSSGASGRDPRPTSRCSPTSGQPRQHPTAFLALFTPVMVDALRRSRMAAREQRGVLARNRAASLYVHEQRIETQRVFLFHSLTVLTETRIFRLFDRRRYPTKHR
jgi:hypothetical protein